MAKPKLKKSERYLKRLAVKAQKHEWRLDESVYLLTALKPTQFDVFAHYSLPFGRYCTVVEVTDRRLRVSGEFDERFRWQAWVDREQLACSDKEVEHLFKLKNVERIESNNNRCAEFLRNKALNEYNQLMGL